MNSWLIFFAVLSLVFFVWACVMTGLYVDKNNDNTNCDFETCEDICETLNVCPELGPDVLEEDSIVKSRAVVKLASLNVSTSNGESSRPVVTQWSERKSALFDCIREVHPSIMGLQEVTNLQKVDIVDVFEGAYGILGEPRVGQDPESNLIMYKLDEFTLLSSDTVNLPKTDPDPLNGGNNQSVFDRTFVWARLEVNTTKEVILVVCTHMPRRANVLNQQNAFQVLDKWIEENRGNDSVFVMADWNPEAPGSPGIQVDELLSKSQDLVISDPQQSGSNGTRTRNENMYYISDTNGTSLDAGRRFDSILYDKRVTPVFSTIVRYMRTYGLNGGDSNLMYGISDHNVVLFVCQLQK